MGIEATIVVLSPEPGAEMLICEDDDPSPIETEPDADKTMEGLATGVETGAEGV